MEALLCAGASPMISSSYGQTPRTQSFCPCGRDLRKAFQSFRTDIVLGGYPFQFPDAFKSDLFPELPLIHPEIPFLTYNANLHLLQ